MGNTTMQQMSIGMHASVFAALPTLAARSGKFEGTGVSADVFAARNLRERLTFLGRDEIANPVRIADQFTPYFADGFDRSVPWRPPV